MAAGSIFLKIICVVGIAAALAVLLIMLVGGGSDLLWDQAF